MSSAEADLTKHVHPASIVRLPAIDSAANAWEDWAAAASALREVDEIALLVAAYDECECEAPDRASCHAIEGHEQRARMAAVLEKNREALRLYDAGTARGALRIPVHPPDFSTHCPFMRESRELVRLKLLEAELKLAHRDPDAAARSLCELLEAGRLQMCGDGLLVDYLLGISFTGVAVHGLGRLLDKQTLGGESLALLRQGVEAIDIVGFLASALQAEFTRWALPTILCFDRVPSDAARVGRWFDWCDGGHEDRLRETFGWRREQVCEVLAGHPRVWDAAETARLISLHFARQVLEITDPGRVGQIDEELERIDERRRRFDGRWPPAFSETIFGLPEADADESDDFAVFEEHNRQIRPLLPEQLAELREEVCGVDNPFGLMLCRELAPGIGVATIAHMPIIEKLANLRARITRLQWGGLGRWARRALGLSRV